MTIWDITDRESFNEIKAYFSEENLTILSSEKTDSGFTVKLSDNDIYNFPPQTWKWIEENSPKKDFTEIMHKMDKLDESIDEDVDKLGNETSDQNPYSNDLIFGKNKTENIVSIDVKDDLVFIYREVNGEITCETQPMKYWIMSNKMPFGEFEKLEGRLHYRYLKEFGKKKDWSEALAKLWKIRADKYTSYNQSEAFMLRNGHTYFKGMKVEDVSILSFDIETNKTLDPNLPHAFTMLISNTFRKNGVIQRKLFAIDEFKNELDMIYSWCAWVREINPSIMTGHNIYSFDLNYLHHRVLNTQKTQVAGIDQEYVKGLPLGRDGSIMEISKKVSQFRKDGSQSYDYHKCNIHGREICDGFFLAIRYDIGRNFPSYGLKPIIKHLGFEKEGRIKWDFTKDDPNEIWEKMQTDKDVFSESHHKWDQYKEYCIDDSDDSLKIFDLMIPAQFYWTVSCPRPFQTMLESATGSQVNGIMIRGYIQENHSIPKPSEKEPFEGAISFGIPGVYRNLLKFDVASLYPSIILQYDIYDKRKDPKKHFIEMTKYVTEERLKNKALANETVDPYYRALEQSEKIAINSMYGFMGGQGLHFNSPENASKITRLGREILTKGIEWATSESVEFWKEKIKK